MTRKQNQIATWVVMMLAATLAVFCLSTNHMMLGAINGGLAIFNAIRLFD